MPWLIVMLVVGGAGDWKQAAKVDGITVYSRVGEGQNVAEMKAVGLIDAAPHQVWAALRDYPNYTQTMPYTEEAKVLSTEGAGKVIHFYTVVNAPLVDRRDYAIRVVDESKWDEGKGFLRLSWKAANEGIPERKDIVRVNVNEGYWILEPRDGGSKTFATYYVYTDPGGSLPKWIVNRANATAVPEVFGAIRKLVAKK